MRPKEKRRGDVSTFHRVHRKLGGIVLICLLFGRVVSAQETAGNWQAEARRYAEARDWRRALEVVDRVLAQTPQDLDAQALRARILLWSGEVEAAEEAFRHLTAAAPRDPDMHAGLASALQRRSKREEALAALDRALELDRNRADLRLARGRILQALGRTKEARAEFRSALELDPGNKETRAALTALQAEAAHELRVGADTDRFNFSGPYQGQWVSLASRWSRRWATVVAGNFYERGGIGAGKAIMAGTGHSARWGALTVGGAAGHDNGIIPRSEFLFEYGRGWRVTESGWVRSVELSYGQHWYWYAGAHVLSLNQALQISLPRDWEWRASISEARSAFPGTPIGWEPSGQTRLTFPAWGGRRIRPNVFFAAGTEDFALAAQLGRFASRTFGGGLAVRLTARQEITAYGAYQQRSQDRTQASFGLSYGFRF